MSTRLLGTPQIVTERVLEGCNLPELFIILELSRVALRLELFDQHALLGVLFHDLSHRDAQRILLPRTLRDQPLLRVAQLGHNASDRHRGQILLIPPVS